MPDPFMAISREAVRRWPNVFMTTRAAAMRGDVPTDPSTGILGDGIINLDTIRELHCVVIGLEVDPGVLKSHQEVFAWNDVHGPWIEQFPSDLIQALAAIDIENAGSIGRSWWKRVWREDEPEIQAEMIREGPYEVLEQIVTRLAELARSVTASPELGLFWVCPDC